MRFLILASLINLTIFSSVGFGETAEISGLEINSSGNMNVSSAIAFLNSLRTDSNGKVEVSFKDVGLDMAMTAYHSWSGKKVVGVIPKDKVTIVSTERLSKGEAVKYLRKSLNALGYKLKESKSTVAIVSLH